MNVVVPQNLLNGNQPISIQVNGSASPLGTYLPIVGFDLEGSASLVLLTVTPATVGLSVGRTAQLGWQVENYVGFAVQMTTEVAWVSSNPQVAFVSASGNVIGVSPGTAAITAFMAGVSGTTTVTVSSPQ